MCKISINSVLLLPRKSLTKSGFLFLVHPIDIFLTLLGIEPRTGSIWHKQNYIITQLCNSACAKSSIRIAT